MRERLFVNKENECLPRERGREREERGEPESLYEATVKTLTEPNSNTIALYAFPPKRDHEDSRN